MFTRRRVVLPALALDVRPLIRFGDWPRKTTPQAWKHPLQSFFSEIIPVVRQVLGEAEGGEKKQKMVTIMQKHAGRKSLKGIGTWIETVSADSAAAGASSSSSSAPPPIPPGEQSGYLYVHREDPNQKRRDHPGLAACVTVYTKLSMLVKVWEQLFQGEHKCPLSDAECWALGERLGNMVVKSADELVVGTDRQSEKVVDEKAVEEGTPADTPKDVGGSASGGSARSGAEEGGSKQASASSSKRDIPPVLGMGSVTEGGSSASTAPAPVVAEQELLEQHSTAPLREPPPPVPVGVVTPAVLAPAAPPPPVVAPQVPVVPAAPTVPQVPVAPQVPEVSVEERVEVSRLLKASQDAHAVEAREIANWDERRAEVDAERRYYLSGRQFSRLGNESEFVRSRTTLEKTLEQKGTTTSL